MFVLPSHGFSWNAEFGSQGALLGARSSGPGCNYPGAPIAGCGHEGNDESLFAF